MQRRNVNHVVIIGAHDNVRALMPGGGFVFHHCRNFHGEVLPQSILARA